MTPACGFSTAALVGSPERSGSCRWFKDWYFAEGGREGCTKLQGTLPLDKAHRARAGRALRAELRAFVMRPNVTEADARAAHAALAALAG